MRLLSDTENPGLLYKQLNYFNFPEIQTKMLFIVKRDRKRSAALLLFEPDINKFVIH